ncbi:hypothetical protein [Clostridium sp. D33t1_170424_F3]|uniref:hypothetical protein n=1 Tax=Clostridium sp. D33t1_170424_F3 TaxID=2787099 RepID=UPI0018AB40FD|nr:hypothetical protein [Clostridium sp. D33t1_170424_F3]
MRTKYEDGQWRSFAELLYAAALVFPRPVKQIWKSDVTAWGCAVTISVSPCGSVRLAASSL